MKIQPCFKIQYPMKNQGKYRVNSLQFAFPVILFFL